MAQFENASKEPKQKEKEETGKMIEARDNDEVSRREGSSSL